MAVFRPGILIHSNRLHCARIFTFLETMPSVKITLGALQTMPTFRSMNNLMFPFSNGTFTIDVVRGFLNETFLTFLFIYWYTPLRNIDL